MDYDKLKSNRTAAKSSMTRIFNWVISNKDTESDVIQFETREKNLQIAFENYNNAQDAIEEFFSDNDMEDRVAIENKFYDTLSLIQNRIKELTLGNQSIVYAETPKKFTGVKLPDITISIFTGNQADWHSFYELFTALIISNDNLTNVQRFFYLKSYLKGEPLKLIDSLQVTNDNFHTAIDILKNRYENLNCVITAYFNSLLETSTITKCNPQNLREFVTNSKRNIESLQNLKVNTTQLYEFLLIYLLQKKLDFGSRKLFEQERNIAELPTLDEFFEFLDKRCIILENLAGPDPRPNKKYDKVTLHTNNKPNSLKSDFFCVYCNNTGHRIYSCHRFIELPYFEKSKFVDSRKLCRNCLGTKHSLENCTSNHKCTHCHKEHHSILHKQNHSHNPPQSNSFSSNNFRNSSNNNTNFQSPTHNNSPANTPNNSRTFNRTPNLQSASTSRPSLSPSMDPNAPQTSFSALTTKNMQILLATAQVVLYTKEGEPVQAKALLDNGSQNSFITQNLVDKLGLRTYHKTLHISGISQKTTLSHKMIDIYLHSNHDRARRFRVSCSVLDNITHQLPQTPIKVERLHIPTNIFERLADPTFYIPSDIDMLIGADVYYSLLCGGVLKLDANFPTLVNTHLGWIVAGNIPHYCSLHTYSLSHLSLCNLTQDIPNSPSNSELENFLTQFWNQEEIPEKHSLNPEDEQIEQLFTSTSKILLDGSYQVDIPLKSPTEHLKLGNSFDVARKRLHALEKRLHKDPTLFSDYKSFIDEYVSLGHARYVPLALQNSNAENKYFIPHLCVIREESTTTKLRVVFDASSKSSTNTSLNDITLKGFQVQPELYDILCRFRLPRFVLTTDITKMFRQIKTNPEHNFLQNILWRDNPQDTLKCIELLTVTYGTNFAPYLSTRVLIDIALKNKDAYPLAAEALLSQCYVDDILCGCDNYTDLRTLQTELKTLLSKHGFHLHKWCSNSLKFLGEISQEMTREYDMNLDEVQSKVLGLKWHPKEDIFCISVPQVPQADPITKRKILSVIAQCFDPLGLVNPVIVKGKIIMQTLWCKKLDWDTPIAEKIVLNEWNNFIDCIPLLKNLRIPRNIFLNKHIIKIEMHGFADASLAAYGACIYIRTLYSDKTVSCYLISSKSRIAPVKTISLPKLELCGMLLLAKLASRITEVFKNKLEISAVILWCDSQIALSWCKEQPRKWTVFVSNRVSQIQTLTSEFHWRYIKSSQNPADILSRGLFSQAILDSGLWFHGPTFLQCPEFELPDINIPNITAPLPEQRKVVLHVAQSNLSKSTIFWYTVFSKFSKFSQLRRILAYILRFVHNCKHGNRRFSGPLTVDELDSALHLIIKTLQDKYFSKEIQQLTNDEPFTNKNFISLKPFVDQYGTLRVGGRLDNAQIPIEQKHPILLPSNDPIVALMLYQEHIRLGHAGAQNVLSNFRLRFWPLNGLRQIKRIIRNCMTCFRFRAHTNQQIMSSLPQERVNISRPFYNVGVDFGGPFLIKSSNLRKAPVIKGYIAIFVCMATKAVHIELVTSLSTEAFIMTLKRFISRRGNPSSIYSDNATNFAGANNQLRELYHFFKNEKNYDSIRNFLTLNETSWKFIPPRSPHWGGLWESAIKSAKYHIKRLIGNSQFTFEVFNTIICQIEAILNSRPLCALSSDPSDLSSLTPGHFLIGSPLTAYPDKDLKTIPENRLNLWQRISQIQQVFWKRWTIEYLNRLQNTPKWFNATKNMQVNQLVLVKDDDSPPLKWPLARVIEVMEGADKKVRVVKLRTSDGVYTRSITKVCPLPDQNMNVFCDSEDAY